MISIEHWGYCPFCLAVRNSMTRVSVRYTSEKDGSWCMESCDVPTDVLGLIAWVEQYRTRRDAIFIVNQYQYAFIPVAIVNGSPVCAMHLWYQTEGK